MRQNTSQAEECRRWRDGRGSNMKAPVSQLVDNKQDVPTTNSTSTGVAPLAINADYLKLVEVAGVEAPSKLSQELGALENGAFVAPKNTCTAPLSSDASSQMLASIVTNWHRLPDDVKRAITAIGSFPDC